MAQRKRTDQLRLHIPALKKFSLLRKLIGIFFVISFFAEASSAQVRWKKVDSLYGNLPPSVHVYKTTDSLSGIPFVAYYVSAALKDKKLQFTAQLSNGNPYTPDQYYLLENSPLVVVNAGFFSFENGQSLSTVIRNGKIVSESVAALRGINEDSNIYYYPTRSAIGIGRKRRADVAWIFTNLPHHRPYAFENAPVIARGKDPAPNIYQLSDIDWKWWEMRTAVGGGPCLVHDGKIWVTNKQEQMFVGEENKKQPRTAMGYTKDGRLIILVIQGRDPGKAEGATLDEEANLMKNLDCYEALNLAGGGSSCMLVNGKETIKPSEDSGQRPVPSAFLIKWSNDQKPK